MKDDDANEGQKLSIHIPWQADGQLHLGKDLAVDTINAEGIFYCAK